MSLVEFRVIYAIIRACSKFLLGLSRLIRIKGGRRFSQIEILPHVAGYVLLSLHVELRPKVLVILRSSLRMIHGAVVIELAVHVHQATRCEIGMLIIDVKHLRLPHVDRIIVRVVVIVRVQVSR